MKIRLNSFAVCIMVMILMLSSFMNTAIAAQVVRDTNNNIIKVIGVEVPGYGIYDVILEDGPRTFNEIWPNFPKPQIPPAFWGDATGAMTARDAVVEVLQAAHIEANQAGYVPYAAMVGNARYAFVVPITSNDGVHMQSTLGYYRHYNDWLWSKGRGVDTITPDAGCGAGGFDKAVYARFSTHIPGPDFTGNIHCTVWNDANSNGQIDAGEKGMPGVVARIPMPPKDAKQISNLVGQCTFANLQEGTFTVTLDESTLPAGATCTTGTLSVSVDVNQAHSNPAVTFGFTNVPAENLGDEIIPLQPTGDPVDADAFTVVEGTTFWPGKVDGGLNWSNVVDGDREGWDGTCQGAVDPASGDDAPWAIFQFNDGNAYQFNCLTYQTDNGTADDEKKITNQVQKMQVLVSTTGTEHGDFTSLGEFAPKNHPDKIRWHKLGEYVTAKYVKIRLLEPTPQYVGGYLQIVEFAISVDKVSGPIPASDIEELVVIPESSELLGNYPNPFNPTTNIVYQVKNDSRVSIRIYDLAGKQVADLVNGTQSAGQYQITWNAHDMPSGVYFMCMQAGTQKATKRILLMK